MSELLVTVGGVLLIALIAWWFWFSGPRVEIAGGSGPIDILVKDGTYQPAAVEVAAGPPVALRFTRLDATPCAEKVVFGTLGVSADLPLGQAQRVDLGALAPGSYEFSCQMGMYRGKLLVR